MEGFYRSFVLKHISIYIYYVIYVNQLYIVNIYRYILIMTDLLDVVITRNPPLSEGIREGIAELFWGTLRKALGKIAGENGRFFG